MGTPEEKRRQSVDLNGWLDSAFSALLTEANENLLEDFPAIAIFRRPIMGVAAGSDGIFEIFRSVVSPRHIRPVDIFGGSPSAPDSPAAVRVVSWAIPFSREIIISNRGREWPSELYSVARNNGAALINGTLERIIRVIQSRGYAAVAPALSDHYDAFRSPQFGFSSTWSERHVAYTAGLGRFGLNGCLITQAGANVRFASLVTTLPLEPTVHKRADYKAPCLENGGRDCGRCLERCPVQAISRNGLDKSKCYERRSAIRSKFLEAYSKTFSLRPSFITKNARREMGFSLGCALCMTWVPCESSQFPEEKVLR